jgi:uncharacterized YccA/Bax inhibitor family protein
MARDNDRSFLSNPAIRDYEGGDAITYGNSFSVQGAAIKSLVLLAILACTFGYTWHLTTQGFAEAYTARPQADGVVRPPDAIDIPGNVIGLALLGCFGGFVVAMIVIFAQRTAPFLAPVYAALEGLALGAISAGFEAKYPGIALQAIGSTLGVTFGMLFLYGTGILRPTAGFIAGLLAAMLGILLLYTVDIIMQCFGTYVPIVHDNSWMGIGLQIFIVGIAALNLIVDFGLITDAAENKAPAWYEWYAGFSLLVTLVWLYLEVLKLIAKFRSND